MVMRLLCSLQKHLQKQHSARVFCIALAACWEAPELPARCPQVPLRCCRAGAGGTLGGA
jgi:hypothetical protein